MRLELLGAMGSVSSSICGAYIKCASCNADATPSCQLGRAKLVTKILHHGIQALGQCGDVQALAGNGQPSEGAPLITGVPAQQGPKIEQHLQNSSHALASALAACVPTEPHSLRVIGLGLGLGLGLLRGFLPVFWRPLLAAFFAAFVAYAPSPLVTMAEGMAHSGQWH